VNVKTDDTGTQLNVTANRKNENVFYSHMWLIVPAIAQQTYHSKSTYMV